MDDLLSLAHDLAERLLPAFDKTETGIPLPRVNLKTGVPEDGRVVGTVQSIIKSTLLLQEEPQPAQLEEEVSCWSSPCCPDWWETQYMRYMPGEQ